MFLLSPWLDVLVTKQPSPLLPHLTYLSFLTKQPSPPLTKEQKTSAAQEQDDRHAGIGLPPPRAEMPRIHRDGNENGEETGQASESEDEGPPGLQTDDEEGDRPPVRFGEESEGSDEEEVEGEGGGAAASGKSDEKDGDIFLEMADIVMGKPADPPPPPEGSSSSAAAGPPVPWRHYGHVSFCKLEAGENDGKEQGVLTDHLVEQGGNVVLSF